ncbi:hypothetical protein PENTCL1PPCAC_19668, partial [Pristionchus entomophagus]
MHKIMYLECFECPPGEYQTLSVNAFVFHLRKKHSTTPPLAGISFLCECGNESYSKDHSQMCILSEVRVIKKKDGPIRRLYE